MSKFKTFKDVADVLYDSTEETAKLALTVEMKCGKLKAGDFIDAFTLACRARSSAEDYDSVATTGRYSTPTLKTDCIFRSLYRLMFYTDSNDDVVLRGSFIKRMEKLRDIYKLKNGYRHKWLDCYEILAEFCETLAKKKSSKDSQLPAKASV